MEKKRMKIAIRDIITLRTGLFGMIKIIGINIINIIAIKGNVKRIY